MRKIFQNHNQYSWYTSPLLFALLFTFLYILFTPNIFNPYRIDTRVLPKMRENYNNYANLDGGEYSENISFGKNYRDERYYIEVGSDKVYLKDSYSFGILESFVADFDGDKYKEVYFCSQRKDSLFLSSYNSKTNEVSYNYLGQLHKRLNSSRSLKFITAYDYNNDGNKEIYLYVNGRFDTDLRCIMRYDIKNKSLIKSKRANSLIVGAEVQNSVQGPRIIYSTWGLRKSPGFSSDDNESYVKAKFACLDSNLQEVFPDYKYDGLNKVVACMNVVVDGKNYAWTLIDCLNPNIKEYKNKTLIEVFDEKGHKKFSRFIPYDVFLLKQAFFVQYNNSKEPYVYITLRQGGILKFDKEVKILKHIKFDGMKTPMLAFRGDIDGDGSLEMLFHDNFRKKNVIVKENFSMHVEFDRPKPFDMFESIAIVRRVKKKRHNSIGHSYAGVNSENLYLESKYLSLYLKYYKENKHWYNYIYILLFFISVYISVWFIRYLVAKNIQEKYEVRNRIAELRFQNVSNQMSPHFTMNAMNSIGSLIFKEDKLQAYDYLTKLAKLMKMSLLDSSKSTRTLNEEIDFVKAYLALQKFRFKDKFDYEIEYNNPSVGKVQLMPFIVQTFVENAIKHGLKDLSSKGFLRVVIQRVEEGVKIIVEDNGIGRKAAILGRTVPSTGKGVKLVKEYMNILNKKDNRKMSIDIVDLYENDKPSGTRVIIFIDFEL